MIFLKKEGWNKGTLLDINFFYFRSSVPVLSWNKKCQIPSLPSSVLFNWLSRTKVYDAIKNHVKFMSQILHHGSHLILLMVVHYYHERLPLPSNFLQNRQNCFQTHWKMFHHILYLILSNMIFNGPSEAAANVPGYA